MESQSRSVRYSDLLPSEFLVRLHEKPIAYLPLGTLEWHGEHLPLGSDAIQSEGLMIQCAQEFGGIVLPPIHLGPDRAKLGEDGLPYYGMDTIPDAMKPLQLTGSCYWVPPSFFNLLIDMILIQLKRVGFKAVFADGHGPSRWAWVKSIPERELRFDLKLFGVTSDIEAVWKSQIDHAAENETSIMLALRPDLVDMSRLPSDLSVSPKHILGEDPRNATAKRGNEYISSAIEVMKQKFIEAGL